MIDNETWKAIIKELLEDYLFNRNTKEEIVLKLAQRTDLTQILSANDELIINSYYALKYLEDEYETSENELKYLYECFNGKKIFSQEERNKFIIDSHSSQ